MKTYLVTGGAGFIGSNYIKHINTKYNEKINIVILDDLTYAGNLKTLEAELGIVEFVKGNICDSETVKDIFEKYDVDFVINFAAESHVDRSIKNPQIFLETNILGTQNLLEQSMKAWMLSDGSYKENARFLQISTDEVYGSLGEVGYFTEETSLDPRSPYSASKTSADLFVNAYIETYNFPALITRCSNNYGPYHFPEKLIPLVIKNILSGKKIPVYGDGLNVRDWLYVEDHCIAIDLVLRNGEIGEVYNVGGHNERTNIEIVKTIIDNMKELAHKNQNYKELFEIDLEMVSYDLIEYVEDRKGHDRRYAIDPTKISRELGWLPKTNFDVGIIKTIEWYFENQDWVNDVTTGEYQNYYYQMYNVGS